MENKGEKKILASGECRAEKDIALGFIQQIFEHMLCAMHCFRSWRLSRE